MSGIERDMSILCHILGYCEQIEQTTERFGDDYSVFTGDSSTAMPLRCACCKSESLRDI